MAGRTQHSAKIESPTARARLKAGRPEYQTLIGKAALGYLRKEEAKHGRWILRRHVGGKVPYNFETLGMADDARAEADGVSVLSYEDAKAMAMAALSVGGEAQPVARLTVRRALANYVDHLTTQGKATDDTERRFAVHVLPKLGDLEVSSLTSGQLNRWKFALATAPALARSKKGAKTRNIKKTADDDPETERRRKSSANRVLTMVKAALNHAYDEKKVNSNDAWGRRVKPFRGVDGARIRFLTVAEAQRLLNACDPDFRLLVRGALETGCRYSELRRLTVADFNPDSGTVHIRRSKSATERHVILTADGAAFFSSITAGKSNKMLMFQNGDRAWNASEQGKQMPRVCEIAKLEYVSFHGLRHSWASLSVMGGVPLLVVAKNLGHVDVRMVTAHYGHLSQSFSADAIRAGAPRFGVVEPKVVSLR
jgi:integrase